MYLYKTNENDRKIEVFTAISSFGVNPPRGGFGRQKAKQPAPTFPSGRAALQKTHFLPSTRRCPNAQRFPRALRVRVCIFLKDDTKKRRFYGVFGDVLRCIGNSERRPCAQTLFSGSFPRGGAPIPDNFSSMNRSLVSAGTMSLKPCRRQRSSSRNRRAYFSASSSGCAPEAT